MTHAGRHLVFLKANEIVGEMMIVKLSDIIDAMQMQSETMSCYLNKKTGEITPISEEEMDAAENGEFTDEAPEWQQEGIKTAREILETDDYISLPSQFDIHEYEIMEKFCSSIKDQQVSADLYELIKGRGAFRRFKNKILQYDIEQDWYQHRDAAYREIAKEWCEENKIEFLEG